ncbi:hypothetical protein E4T49_06795 [Aureobasidium sp. EXF-10728]|nr:hypothetical protein E4T49_06795 [Aureobasidium sp. EXF-10728]
MPSAEHDDLSTSSQGITSDNLRRVSTNISIAAQLQHSPKSRLSDTPLTPEESPPFRDHRKRSADALDQDEIQDVSPSHTRDGSTESLVNFCLCQPEPKVPRPRNAFILYRQNRQAAVVAQNPGLANPEISKIIGEQWRNEPEGEKNRWKAYAEPKRSGRRGSVSSESGFSQSDHRKCQKCGGRTIIHPTPSTPSSARERLENPRSLETSPSSAYPQPPRLNAFQLPPPTPSSTTTPSTRYLPMLNNLSLSSPHPRNMSNGRPSQPFMVQRGEEEHSSILSPDSKRRRFESPQGTYVMSTRTMAPRQNAGPGTPFPFGPQGQPHVQQNQQMGPPHHFQPPPGAQHVRRESLPRPADLLRGPVPPNMMGPPPRPGPGYSQHRASQGQRTGGPELSLTLPPLQAGTMSGPPTSTRVGPGQPSSGSRGSEHKEPDRRSVGEIIVSMSFMAKVQILGRVAPALSTTDHNKSRATIIAIEGDDAEAARNVTDWLEEFLGREGDMVVKVVDGPKLPEGKDGPEVEIPELLRTVAEWHDKGKKIEQVARGDKERKDSDSSSQSSSVADSEAMEVDSSHGSSSRVVILLRTYTVTASNVFASRVAIKDAYKAADHWQWTATLWRGIVGPDMTVYVKDADKTEDGGKGGVEIKEENRIMAVRRFKGSEENGGVEGIEAGTLRRLGFEVGEWVRSGGAAKKE